MQCAPFEGSSTSFSNTPRPWSNPSPPALPAWHCGEPDLPLAHRLDNALRWRRNWVAEFRQSFWSLVLKGARGGRDLVQFGERLVNVPLLVQRHYRVDFNQWQPAISRLYPGL